MYLNSEKFCIKWTDLLKSSSSNLRHAKDFTDVTIMGDDFKKTNAHRIMLATCSKYSEQILQEFKQHCTTPLMMVYDSEEKKNLKLKIAKKYLSIGISF